MSSEQNLSMMLCLQKRKSLHAPKRAEAYEGIEQFAQINNIYMKSDEMHFQAHYQQILSNLFGC
jgi:hypothetical protein